MRMWMMLLQTLGTTLLAVLVLLLYARAAGVRPSFRRSPFSSMIAVAIGVLAALMIAKPQTWPPILFAMGVLIAAALLTDMGKRKSAIVRRLLYGKPIVLMERGAIKRKNLIRGGIDLPDFLELCRMAGYFDLDEIETAVLERNGELSVLPTSEARWTRPSDFGIQPRHDSPRYNIILEGILLKQNLRMIGRDEQWLRMRLHALGYSGYRQVLLATCDRGGALSVYPMEVTPQNTPKPYT